MKFFLGFDITFYQQNNNTLRETWSYDGVFPAYPELFGSMIIDMKENKLLFEGYYSISEERAQRLFSATFKCTIRFPKRDHQCRFP